MGAMRLTRGSSPRWRHSSVASVSSCQLARGRASCSFGNRKSSSSWMLLRLIDDQLSAQFLVPDPDRLEALPVRAALRANALRFLADRDRPVAKLDRLFR